MATKEAMAPLKSPNEPQDQCLFGKGKNMLIKHNIPRDVDTIIGHMKTFVSLMKRAITKENILLGTKLELGQQAHPNTLRKV